MTRMQRQVMQKQQRDNVRMRVLRVVGILVAVLGLAFLLFNLDRGFRNRRQAHLRSKGEKVLLKQSRESDKKETDLQKVDLSEDPPIRRYRMTLAKLEGDSSTATIDLDIYRDWSPMGAAHFHRLITTAHFYDQARFFRVLPKFVVQFGINAEPAVQKEWRQVVLADDPVVESNQRGTITYATSGPNTRTTQIFINTGNNKSLDKQGFAPMGKVVNDKDLEILDRIQSKYREKPNQGKIQNRGNEYLQEEFPDLSYIVSIEEIPLPDDSTQ